jgi:hypothetical protein
MLASWGGSPHPLSSPSTFLFNRLPEWQAQSNNFHALLGRCFTRLSGVVSDLRIVSNRKLNGGFRINTCALV